VTYAIGALAGLIYGGLFGLVKHLFRNSSLLKKKDAVKQVYIYMAVSMAINIAVLLSIYFVRNLLPWSFTAMLIAAAVSLSLAGKLSAFRGQKQGGENERKVRQEG